MNDYLIYMERVNDLVTKKQELLNIIKEKRTVQAKYLDYLDNNPYRDEMNRLRELECMKRAELMNLIPNKYV